MKWTDTKPQELIQLMSEGKLNCQICKAFRISRETFSEWVATKPEFRAAYEEGMPLAEAKFMEFAMEKMHEGDEKGFKYWISIMNNKFGWAKDAKEVRNTQINISNMNVLNTKSDAELIEFIQHKLESNQLIELKADGPKESTE